MHRFITILIICIFSIFASAQDCDFKYGSSIVMIPKNHEMTQEMIELWSNNVNKYKRCLEEVVDSTKIYWLHNRIAFNLTDLESDHQNAAYHAKQAYDFGKEQLCKDYVRIYVYHERDSTFPMKRHFLDRINDSAMQDVCDYCLENYKEAELEIYREKDRKRIKQQSTSGFIESYFAELEQISADDQKEREKVKIDWEVQGILDKRNRMKLDSLYKVHGFPSVEKVSHDGIELAFFVLHHSADCEWNETWTKRFIEHYDQLNRSALFSFYMFRNFNEEDGQCYNKSDLIDQLKSSRDSTLVKKLLDFSKYDK